MTDGCGQDGFVIAVHDKNDKDKVVSTDYYSYNQWLV